MFATHKKSMREALKEKRALLYQLHSQAGEKAADHFFTFFDFYPNTIFGVYWPIGKEFNSCPLLYGLFSRGYICALPNTTPEGLVFRLWEPSLELEQAAFGIMVPPISSPVIVPDVLIVPLLGFDRGGHRIGYGKGHYDRYLHLHKVKAIGLSFSGQEIVKVPHEIHDIQLNYVVTEEGVIQCL